MALAAPALAAQTSGAGSTFVYPVMAKWVAAYQAETGNKVIYQSIGSHLGINEARQGRVDFGASDMPLKPEELDKLGMSQFPLVIGGVVPVVHIEGIQPGAMRFTGQLLADIFLGRIKKWNDPAIRQINPDLKLPDLAITVIHRVDGSGTTFNWTNYLSKVSSEWKARIGEGPAVEWPVGLGAKGNGGVASLVELMPGSIGYLEYAYAMQKKGPTAFGLVQNQAGKFVSPRVESLRAATSGADWINAKDFFLIMTDAAGDQAYPITATVFVLMRKQPKSPEGGAAALDFLKWALQNGQAQAESLDYMPLPTDLVNQILAYWKAHFTGWKS
jgi:phosphate transport system substrate-binding protein